MKTAEEQFRDKQANMSNEALIGFVEDQISDLAKSYGKSHKMSIPPSITDTDMLLSELVRRFKEYANQPQTKEVEKVSTVYGRIKLPSDNDLFYKPQTKEVDWDEIRNIISDNMDRLGIACLLYTSPSPRDGLLSRMPSSA